MVDDRTLVKKPEIFNASVNHNMRYPIRLPKLGDTWERRIRRPYGSSGIHGVDPSFCAAGTPGI